MFLNLTESLQDMHLRAGIPDKRQMILELFKQEKSDRLPVFDFALRLNHSTLLTSKTRWPANWRTRFADIAAKSRSTLSLTADQWLAAFVTNSFSESTGSMLLIADDIYGVLQIAMDNFFAESEQLYADYQKMEQNVVDGYNGNAFYVKIAIELGSAVIKDIPFGAFARDFVEFLEKTGNRFFEVFTGESDGFTRWKTSAAENFAKVKEIISIWLGEQWADWPTAKSSKILEELASIFRQMAQEYDQVI